MLASGIPRRFTRLSFPCRAFCIIYTKRDQEGAFVFFKSSGMWGWRKVLHTEAHRVRRVRCYSAIILQGSASWPTFSPSVNGRFPHLLSRGLAIARDAVCERSNVVCRSKSRTRFLSFIFSFRSIFPTSSIKRESNWRTSPSSRSGSHICDYYVIDSQCGVTLKLIQTSCALLIVIINGLWWFLRACMDNRIDTTINESFTVPRFPAGNALLITR